MTETPARGESWGRWGADDERGALNLLTPERVQGALRAAREGRVLALGLPIQRHGPHLDYRGAPLRLTLLNHSDEAMLAAYGADRGTGSNEDVLVLPSHTGTHMDALAHVYADGAIYNGFPHDGMAAYGGAARCGIEHVGPVVARGVLIDVARHLGVDALAPGHVIARAELEGAIAAQGVELRPGDAVLVRTGWVERFLASGEMTLEQPGLGLEAALALAEADVALVGADNSAVEAMPFDGGEFMTVHVALLVRRGIYLVEHLKLDELAATGAREFLFAVSPLPVVGATASPVSPFAIV